MDNDLHIEQLVQKSSMPKNLGVEFADLSPVRVVASMPVDDRHLQPLGFLHGGASVTLAKPGAVLTSCLKGSVLTSGGVSRSVLKTQPRAGNGRRFARRAALSSIPVMSKPPW
jgi:hypothetical protein